MKCNECNEEYSMKRTTREADGYCFDCSFWLGHIARRIGNNAPWRDSSVIVNHTAYHVNPDGEGGFRGHGGHKFKIQFFDGRQVVSHNLWCQGDIDERFRDRLPNNAEFVEEFKTH